MLHFVWQITTIGKIDSLRWFIKHIFHVNYRNHWNTTSAANSKDMIMVGSHHHHHHHHQATIHGEIFSNLASMLRQNNPIQDQVQMNRLLQNCWFFFDISLKSLAIYVIQYRQHQQQQQQSQLIMTHLDVESNTEFYESLKTFTDLLGELMLKYASSQSSSLSKDNEFIAAYRCCNRSLAVFFKVS